MINFPFVVDVGGVIHLLLAVELAAVQVVPEQRRIGTDYGQAAGFGSCVMNYDLSIICAVTCAWHLICNRLKQDNRISTLLPGHRIHDELCVDVVVDEYSVLAAE